MTHSVEETVYAFSAVSNDGRPIPLEQFRGQVLLIVNTASKCVFTSQYAGLERLYSEYKDRGLVVLGFPCNQFGAQEPASDREIAQFCDVNYGVSFPIFAKVDVNGPNAHPLFQYLKKERAGFLGLIRRGAIQWNFTKFLIDRQGRVVSRHAPAASPEGLRPEIEKLLR
jgi:glutathione peroxidase